MSESERSLLEKLSFEKFTPHTPDHTKCIAERSKQECRMDMLLTGKRK
jgi:hypothetical protein